MADFKFTPADEACPHCWDDASLRAPIPGAAAVFKDDCAYCPATSEHGDGIYVCMQCHQGLCRAHLRKHTAVTQHTLYMRIKKSRGVRTEEPKTVLEATIEPPPTFETGMVCTGCDVELVEGVGLSAEVLQGIMAAVSPRTQDSIQQNQWADYKPCKHCGDGLTQLPEAEREFTPSKPVSAGAVCSTAGCEVAGNNWMCLTCGAVGCPRQEAGGQMHAINHFLMTGHPMVVKLGTVTPAGADVHCYSCDDEVVDPDLARHLAAFGVDMNSSVKTAKSLGEMMLDQTLQYDFSKITEAGADLVPCFGPGHTGLRNFGNTCYIASVLQCLLASRAFTERFVTGDLSDHQATCTERDPRQCYRCVWEKVAKGLASGSYALPLPPATEEAEGKRAREAAAALNGITPVDFKKWVAKDHAEFSTGNQQDAEEFLRHLLVRLQRAEFQARGEGPRPFVAPRCPTAALDFVVEERRQCLGCQAVRYKTSVHPLLSLMVPVEPYVRPLGDDGAPVAMTDEEVDATRPRTSLDELLSHYLMPGSIDGVRCETCGQRTTVATTQKLRSFPDVLCVHLQRVYVDKATFTQKKLDVLVSVDESLDVERLRSRGPAEGENVVEQTTDGGSAPPAPTTGGAAPVEVDELSLVTVCSMGIELETARWALQQTGNNVERAVDWVFSHPEGPPAPAPTSAPAPTTTAAPAVLEDVVGHRTPAGYELFGLVSHIGSSAAMGHYVAHIKKAPAEGGEPRWVNHNDEKVALSQSPPKSFATLYFYRRIE